MEKGESVSVGGCRRVEMCLAQYVSVPNWPRGFRTSAAARIACITWGSPAMGKSGGGHFSESGRNVVPV